MQKKDKAGCMETLCTNPDKQNDDLDQWWALRSGQIIDIVRMEFPDRSKRNRGIKAFSLKNRTEKF